MSNESNMLKKNNECGGIMWVLQHPNGTRFKKKNDDNDIFIIDKNGNLKEEFSNKILILNKNLLETFFVKLNTISFIEALGLYEKGHIIRSLCTDIKYKMIKDEYNERVDLMCESNEFQNDDYWENTEQFSIEEIRSQWIEVSGL